MDQRFLDETVSRRGALFEAMVDFNRNQLRASVASRGTGKLPIPSLLADANLRRAYAQSQNSTSRVQSQGWWDFSDETCRLVLLKTDQLKNLALCFSAALFAEELALILDGKQVRTLRTLLGDDVYFYAVRRGRYQIGSLRQTIISYLPPAPLTERIPLLARAILQLICEGWPEELQQLWSVRLAEIDFAPASAANPLPAVSSMPLPQLSREQRRALWFTLKKILLREAAPQWVPCFD